MQLQPVFAAIVKGCSNANESIEVMQCVLVCGVLMLIRPLQPHQARQGAAQSAESANTPSPAAQPLLPTSIAKPPTGQARPINRAPAASEGAFATWGEMGTATRRCLGKT